MLVFVQIMRVVRADVYEEGKNLMLNRIIGVSQPEVLSLRLDEQRAYTFPYRQDSNL